METTSSHPATSSHATLIELPFGLPGHIFRSPMPFRAGDEKGAIFRQYLEQQISTVVMLVSDAEAEFRTGRNLRQFYKAQGIEVIHLPIPDYYIPSPDELSTAVDTALARAHLGQNIAVHCYAGIGRTGTFLACMAKRALSMASAEAIAWVRAYIPTAVEVDTQVQVVEHFT